MITAVVLTKNEEKNIADCLESLKWCDEIVVVDDNSTDKTLELLKKTKAKVFTRSLDGNFSSQKNFGLEKAGGDWILFVDADERITDALRYEIESTISNSLNTFNGFFIKRIDSIWGRQLKYGEAGSIKLLRLAKKDSGNWSGVVHEEWRVKGRVSLLKNPIRHYPHQSISDFLREINFYTDLRSKQLYDRGVRVYFWSIIIYPKGKFLLNYFLKRGFIDGMPGLVFAIIMSFHSFLVRGKLWILWQKK